MVHKNKQSTDKNKVKPKSSSLQTKKEALANDRASLRQSAMEENFGA